MRRVVTALVVGVMALAAVPAAAPVLSRMGAPAREKAAKMLEDVERMMEEIERVLAP